MVKDSSKPMMTIESAQFNLHVGIRFGLLFYRVRGSDYGLGRYNPSPKAAEKELEGKRWLPAILR